MVDEHLNSINSPFKFNGKEYDAETGNYYYGARYYDPKWSVWTSVDPLAEKFAGRSSYEYCFGNPLNFVDSTGMGGEGVNDIIQINQKGTVVNVIKMAGDNIVLQLDDKNQNPKVVNNLDESTKQAKGIKNGDMIVDGGLFRLVENATICRVDINMDTGDYGHWWIETGKDESYGWWPKYGGVGKPGAVTGVDGELNGQTAFEGTPTRDPHHGDRHEGVHYFHLFTKDAAPTKNVVPNIRKYAKDYSGSWSYPFGQNCHSFQEGFLKKFNLTINPYEFKNPFK